MSGFKLVRTDNGVDSTLWSTDKTSGRIEVRLDSWDAQFDSDSNPNFWTTAVEPTDPPADPPPPTAPLIVSPFKYPETEAQFVDAVQSEINAQRVALLDPRTNIEVRDGIVLRQSTATGFSWGINGNHAKLTWKGAAGGTMLKIEGVRGQPGRCVVVEGLNFDGFNYGNGYAAPPAGICLHLAAPLGDNGPLYKFVLRDIYTMNAGNGSVDGRGVVLEGGVYEGACFNVHAENHSGHGVELVHTNVAGEAPGIISNVSFFDLNSSRNGGAGLKTEYSVTLVGGSFINNRLGGVVAPQGIRTAAFCNGENTGEALFVLGGNGYGSALYGNELSGNASLVYNGWGKTGTPAKYVVSCPQPLNLIDAGNHVSYYGKLPDPMRVLK